MSQTAYNEYMAIGAPGLIADNSQRNIRSMRATVAILFGLVVAQDSGASDCRLPTGDTDQLVGVAATKPSTEMDLTTGIAQYNIKDTVNVLDEGTVYVTTEQDVGPGDPVFVRFAAGSGTQLGAVRKDADTATATSFPGARFRTSALAGGLVQLKLNLPQN